jgi:hypothetical protein
MDFVKLSPALFAAESSPPPIPTNLHREAEMACGEEARCDMPKRRRKGESGSGWLRAVMKNCVIVVVVLPIAALWCRQSFAQSGTPVNNADYLSKETENPVTRKITVPLRYEADFLDGADKLTKSTIELDQAVVPFRLNDDWALITRTKLPVEALPPKNAGDHWADGLSNGYTTFFLSPEHGQGFYWGAGPVLYYPATNDALGTTRWGSGPSVAFLRQDKGPWVVGLVANNIWSFGGGPGSSNRTK